MSTFDIHLILPCAALVIIMPLSCARIFSNSALLENRACLYTLHGALRQNDVVAFLLVFKLKKVTSSGEKPYYIKANKLLELYKIK